MTRPAILDEIVQDIEPSARQDQLVKAQKDLEANLLEHLANVRLQENIVELKETALQSVESSEREHKLRQESLENARLILEDRYQGAEALANELKRVNQALDEMQEAGMAVFGNRAARRAKQ